MSIRARLGPIGWFDFQREAEAIKIGVDAIDQINEAIAPLSHPVTANESRRSAWEGCPAGTDIAAL